MTFQLNLFQDKEDFNPDDFEAKCINSLFIDIVRKAITDAVSIVSDADLPIRKRVRSDAIHDVAFRNIDKLAAISEIYSDFIFFGDRSGNKREYFQYNNYYFIISNGNSNGTKSKISDRIENQEGEKHIITIEYVVNDVQDGLVSLSFQYKKNNNVLMSHYLPLTPANKVSYKEYTAKDPGSAKASLKKSAKENEK